MTTKRRFIRLNDTYIIDTHDGNEYYCPCEPLFLDKINHTIEDYKNTIKKDYIHIKRLEHKNINTTNIIQEAYKNEKTTFGKSVLRQLLEKL